MRGAGEQDARLCDILRCEPLPITDFYSGMTPAGTSGEPEYTDNSPQTTAGAPGGRSNHYSIADLPDSFVRIRMLSSTS